MWPNQVSKAHTNLYPVPYKNLLFEFLFRYYTAYRRWWHEQWHELTMQVREKGWPLTTRAWVWHLSGHQIHTVLQSGIQKNNERYQCIKGTCVRTSPIYSPIPSSSWLHECYGTNCSQKKHSPQTATERLASLHQLTTYTFHLSWSCLCNTEDQKLCLWIFSDNQSLMLSWLWGYAFCESLYINIKISDLMATRTSSNPTESNCTIVAVG